MENCCFYLLVSYSPQKRKRITHRYSVVSVVNPHLVLLPVDGGFGVPPGGLALQDGRLAGPHHHISGILPEIISQH